VSQEGGYSFVATSKLCHTNGEEYTSLASGPTGRMRPENRPMLGQDTCGGLFVVDQGEQNGCYFWFPDLSIRRAGEYCLEITVVEMNSPFNMQEDKRRLEVAKTMSEPFRVYSSKDFPGNEKVTALTQWLEIQYFSS
jgi:hypothetical protein